MLAFFSGTQKQKHSQLQHQPPAVVMRGSAASSAAAYSKRGSITSISDEIMGEEDLHNVDEVFESLLYNTFTESESSFSASTGRTRARKGSASAAGKGPRTSESESNVSSLRSSKSRTSSVTRKPSKSKLVAGEVKAPQLQSTIEQEEDQHLLRQKAVAAAN